MDLNHLFLFVAVISPLLVLVLSRAWRADAAGRGWRVPSLVVLLITGLSWILFRQVAGFIGGGAWFVFLFIPAVGSRKLTDLIAQHRYKSARRLCMALLLVHPSAELREQLQFLNTLQSGRTPHTDFGRAPASIAVSRTSRLNFRDAPAVLILILLNIAGLLVEMSLGNWNDFMTLHRLGALEPWRVVLLGEYWRLFTALFLHAGVAHLFFNVFALYVLGPGLERAIGLIRFLACYLISGIGSSVGVVALWRLGLTSAGQVVGASGCIMGIVGAWAGFLIRHRHIPRARERLRNILLIIMIQTAFDLTTPQVSTAAHVCGLATGFIVGLFFAAPKLVRHNHTWPGLCS